MKRRILAVVGIALCLSLLAIHSTHSKPAETRVEISYPAALDNWPITGRVFVIISKSDRVEPRLQAGSYQASVPFWGQDVNALKAGESAVMDAGVLGFPLKSLSEIPAGGYYVQ